MPTVDQAISDTLALGEVLTPEKDARALADTLTFGEVFCVETEVAQASADSLTFAENLIGTNNYTSEATNPPGGLDDPPHSMHSFLSLRKRLADPIIFEERMEVVGGMILDTGCTPNTLTPNFPLLCLFDMTEEEYFGLEEDEYYWLLEFCD